MLDRTPIEPYKRDSERYTVPPRDNGMMLLRLGDPMLPKLCNFCKQPLDRPDSVHLSSCETNEQLPIYSMGPRMTDRLEGNYHG